MIILIVHSVDDANHGKSVHAEMDAVEDSAFKSVPRSADTVSSNVDDKQHEHLSQDIGSSGSQSVSERVSDGNHEGDQHPNLHKKHKEVIQDSADVGATQQHKQDMKWKGDAAHDEMLWKQWKERRQVHLQRGSIHETAATSAQQISDDAVSDSHRVLSHPANDAFVSNESASTQGSMESIQSSGSLHTKVAGATGVTVESEGTQSKQSNSGLNEVHGSTNTAGNSGDDDRLEKSISESPTIKTPAKDDSLDRESAKNVGNEQLLVNEQNKKFMPSESSAGDDGSESKDGKHDKSGGHSEESSISESPTIKTPAKNENSDHESAKNTGNERLLVNEHNVPSETSAGDVGSESKNGEHGRSGDHSEEGSISESTTSKTPADNENSDQESAENVGTKRLLVNEHDDSFVPDETSDGDVGSESKDGEHGKSVGLSEESSIPESLTAANNDALEHESVENVGNEHDKKFMPSETSASDMGSESKDGPSLPDAFAEEKMFHKKNDRETEEESLHKALSGDDEDEDKMTEEGMLSTNLVEKDAAAGDVEHEAANSKSAESFEGEELSDAAAEFNFINDLPHSTDEDVSDIPAVKVDVDDSVNADIVADDGNAGWTFSALTALFSAIDALIDMVRHILSFLYNFIRSSM